MSVKDYELELLDNAIDYLNEAMKYYLEAKSSKETRLYKFCILHFVSFAELFLKHYVSLESHLLIYKNITTKIGADSQTITISDSIKILENLNTNYLKEAGAEVTKLQKLRNDAQHHRISYNSETVSIDIGQLLQEFIQFDESNKSVGIIDRTLPIYHETLHLIKTGYLQKLEQAEKKMNLIENSIFKNVSPKSYGEIDFEKGLVCYNCFNLTVYRHNGDYKCTFCKYIPNYTEKCNICGEEYDSEKLPFTNGLCGYHYHAMSKDD